MLIGHKQIYFEVIKESFLDNVNILTRYQFIDEFEAVKFYVKIHDKYNEQTEEEKSKWCCRFVRISPYKTAETLSVFGYSILTWQGSQNAEFTSYLERYRERIKSHN